MWRQIRPAIMMIIVMTDITGLVCPLGMPALAQPLPYDHRCSSLPKTDEGTVTGASLSRQNFTDDKEWHGRASATTQTDPNDSPRSVPAPHHAPQPGSSNI